MKKIYWVLFSSLAFASCQKNDLPIDNGCISQIKRQNFQIISADSVAAVNLLKQNNLPFNDLQFEYIRVDTAKNNGSTDIFQNIFGIQFINGLPILSYDFGYAFKDGVFQEITGKKYNGVNLDTHSTQTLPRLRELYLTEVNKNTHNLSTYKDSCVVAEFGYYDLNATTNNSTPNFVKAWSVTPKHARYPQVFFRNDNGGTIVYYGGLFLD
jgi:hypothetical protein